MKATSPVGAHSAAIPAGQSPRTLLKPLPRLLFSISLLMAFISAMPAIADEIRPAFLFGLFHGLGFAGALSEIGVPQHEVPLALLMFNVGVESGQILFILAVFGLLALLRRLPVTAPEGAWRLVPYSIGGIAAFWTIERVLAFLPQTV